MANLSLTYTLTNGSTEDATQVMQNFNDISGYINTHVIRDDGAVNMAAALNLFNDPTADAHAVRKAYMDGAFANATNGASQVWTANVTNTVKFSTNVRDTATAYSTATGQFTAPKTGVYLASWTSKPDQSNNMLVRMGILAGGTTYNGPKYNPKSYNNLNEAAQATFALPVYVTAGQTIEPNCSTSSTVTLAMGESFAVTWLHG